MLSHRPFTAKIVGKETLYGNVVRNVVRNVLRCYTVIARVGELFDRDEIVIE